MQLTLIQKIVLELKTKDMETTSNQLKIPGYSKEEIAEGCKKLKIYKYVQNYKAIYSKGCLIDFIVGPLTDRGMKYANEILI